MPARRQPLGGRAGDCPPGHGELAIGQGDAVEDRALVEQSPGADPGGPAEGATAGCIAEQRIQRTPQVSGRAGGTSNPVSRGDTASRHPRIAVATTGRSIADASSNVRGKPSR